MASYGGKIAVVVGRRTWRWIGIQPSKTNVTMLLFGLGLILATWLGSHATIGDTEIAKHLPLWSKVVLTAVGGLSIGWGLLMSRRPDEELRTGLGFLGTPPRLPVRFVARQ